MTKIQEITQCDGPWRPAAERLLLILAKLPSHMEIRAISINGQSGYLAVECHHEGLDMVHEFGLKEDDTQG